MSRDYNHGNGIGRLALAIAGLAFFTSTIYKAPKIIEGIIDGLGNYIYKKEGERIQIEEPGRNIRDEQPSHYRFECNNEPSETRNLGNKFNCINEPLRKY